MSRICANCGKHPRVANSVSHANNRVKRWVYPNVHRMRFTVTGDASGKVHAGSICAKCQKSGLVKKVI